MFVSFEGIDGSGKTTLSNLVVKSLKAQGLTVKHLRAGGTFSSDVSEAIRTLSRDSRNLQLGARAEFLLYLARDVQLVEEALPEALERYDIVIADRFVQSAEALARFGRGLPAAYTRQVLAAVTDVSPDLVLLVDVDPVLARARRKADKAVRRDSRPPSRKGLSGVGLQHRMREGYLQLAREAPERWAVVDNEGTLQSTCDRLTELIARASREGTARALAAFAAQRPAAPRPPVPINSPQVALERLLGWVDARAEHEPQVAAYLLGGLHGPGVDERRRELAQRVPVVVLQGLGRADDEVSWSLRHELSVAQPEAVARSLGGLPGNDARAAALRERLSELVPVAVLGSLAGSDDAAAWQLRDRWYEAHPTSALASLSGLPGERAWELRARWRSTHGNALEFDYELARAAARSIVGLDDDRAWELRKLCRAAAPVASLASIGGSLDERAWSWRERMLRRASKVVMETLRQLVSARAFELRAAVAADVKEAIDSLRDLDHEAAWRLREQYADVWTSTVIKSLGPLADSLRGRTLLERQLQRYPGNVSLLKHAAAIALGVHHRPVLEGL